jgi:glycosyltransferase involved in cell wall biosynthesis
MKEMLSVSVIIPSFNRPQPTLRAVKSVLAQTWNDFEIIVIDDGSRSDQIFPIGVIDDERVRLIRHPLNLGVSAARNTGVKESSYPLIAFLDSDDRWLPDKLASQISAYDKHGSKKDVLVYSSYYQEQGKTQIVYPLTSWKRNQALSDFVYLDYGSLHASTWLTSRTLLQRFPFDVHLSQCEDYDLLLRMEAAGVEFVWCKMPAAVRNCDLREDRLSIRLRKDIYLKFLEQNSKRLTPMSYVVLESVVLNATDRGSLGTKLQNHIRHFLKSPRLNWLSRIGLVLTYCIRRCTVKTRLVFNMRPAQIARNLKKVRESRDMKVSIVIVNYNYARFLRQAIESALAQTYCDKEIVVIDDGSTDDSAEVIRSYGGLIIPVLKSNAGQSSCYSRGLAVSSGDLVLYLDADDFLNPHCLSEVVSGWKQGCVKAHFYLDVVDESGARMDAVVPSGRLARGTDPLKMMRLFGSYCSPPGSGNVYSREYLRKILPKEDDSEFRRFEASQFGGDSVAILAAPYFGAIAAIPQILGCYRRHTNASGAVTAAFQAESSLKTLETEYRKELVRDHAWRIAARRTETPKLLEPSRLKRRFCYLRLSGRGLDPADNRLNLFAKGVLYSILWDGYSWAQKIAISGWFVGMAVLPSKIAEMLIRPALGLSNRTLLLRKFLQRKER